MLAALRAEAAAWAAVADAPVPAGPDSTGSSFQPHPDWKAAEAAFCAAHPDLDGRADAARLVPAFGPFEPGDETHRRLCWLCVNAARMVRHCWDEIAENPDARDRLAALADVLRGDWFLRGEGAEPDWAPLTDAATARRDGEQVNDCDACRVEPVAAAVAFAARFARDSKPADAAECLRRVRGAADEGCWWCDPAEPDTAHAPFAAWFVAHALPAAWGCEELPPCDPGVPVWRVV